MKGKPKTKKSYRKGGNRNQDYKSSKQYEDRPHRSDNPSRLSALNDFSWYNRNPLLTQAVASVPFPYRPGMRMPLKPNAQTGDTFPSFKIPGVMRLMWVPSIGTSNGPTDPASIAAKEVYAKVRNAFSGTLDADPPDYIIYFMALDSIFSYIGHLKRIYRILNAYTPQNYIVPDVLLKAMGLSDPAIQNLKAERMQLFQITNELIGMTRKFECPDKFDIMRRHYWMNDNVYTDAPSANSQFFMFTQVGFFQYRLQDTPDGVPAGGLITKTVDFQNPLQAFTFGQQLISALAESDDGYTISGYLKRAYEGSPSFFVDELRMDEIFTPVYVPEVLAQIENSMTVSSFGTFTASSIVVSQDPKTNSLICNPKCTKVTGEQGIYPVISIRNDAPSVVDVVEATRLKAYVNEDGSIIAASEVPVGWQCFYNGNIYEIDQAINIIRVDGKDVSSSTVQSLFISLAVTQYDWAPLIFVNMNWPALTGNPSNTQIFGDVHNITTITPEQLYEIHKVCLYSEFDSFNQA